MRQKSSDETSGNALTAETRGRKMERGKSPGYHSNSRKGEDMTLWHHRSGHMSEKGIQIIHSRNLLPECYEEEVHVETRKKWEQAMKEEMDSLAHDQTLDLVKMSVGKTTLQNKWVYKLKEEDGGRKRYKYRLVVKGFAQKKGIEFDEIFSPVVKMTSIKTILSLVVAEDLHLE
eukprot:PITA_21211